MAGGGDFMDKMKRFVDAHKQSFDNALSEIRQGKKRSHWMWFLFPQIKGLGFSETSRYYALDNLSEAQTFLDHPVLGLNLILITSELLKLKSNNATAVFGQPDDVKLLSSMTLFSLVPQSNPVFQKVIEQYFDNKLDSKTLEIVASS